MALLNTVFFLHTVTLPRVQVCTFTCVWICSHFPCSSCQTVAELSSFSPSYRQAAEVLVHLESSYPHLSLEPLTFRQEGRFLEIYKPLSRLAGIGEGEEEDGADDSGDDENLRPSPPYPDPYNFEEPQAGLKMFPPGGPAMDNPMLLFHSFFPQRIDLEPLASLMAAEDLLSSTQFSLQKLAKQRDFINKHIEKSSFTCKVWGAWCGRGHVHVRVCVCVCVCVVGKISIVLTQALKICVEEVAMIVLCPVDRLGECA